MEHAAQVEQGLWADPHQLQLEPHTSSLPNALYILSFAPPVPSPFRRPRAFISHPYILYTVGTLAAMVAGVGLPAFDIVFGYWTNGIANLGTPPSAIKARGNEAGWIMTIVGVVTVICFSTFLTCCECAGAIMPITDDLS
jgi:ATP-binding cassette subfamily B (MDR/TAP) protein 1